MALRIVSFNVNGLRACTNRGFLPWLKASRAQIVGLQEVRALPEQLAPEVRRPSRFHAHFSPAQRRGYSGVALYSRRKPERVETSLDEPRFDDEGRLQIGHFGPLVVANAYFPKGSGTERDNSRVPYKLDFYRALFSRLARLRDQGRRVIVMGDFNTAHGDIDLARPASNRKNSGFLPEERAELSRWLAAGWIDTFRHQEPGPGHYTWWRQWGEAKARNVGWRIDYVLACPRAMDYFRRAHIWSEVSLSDHCPVGVDLDPAILR